VRVLETAPRPAPEPALTQKRPWLGWLVFLLVLALAWQLLKTR
jgi:hypothetical protein